MFLFLIKLDIFNQYCRMYVIKNCYLSSYPYTFTIQDFTSNVIHFTQIQIVTNSCNVAIYWRSNNLAVW